MIQLTPGPESSILSINPDEYPRERGVFITGQHIGRPKCIYFETLDEEKVKIVLKKIKTVWSQGDAGKETMLQLQKSALEGILC